MVTIQFRHEKGVIGSKRGKKKSKRNTVKAEMPFILYQIT